MQDVPQRETLNECCRRAVAEADARADNEAGLRQHAIERLIQAMDMIDSLKAQLKGAEVRAREEERREIVSMLKAWPTGCTCSAPDIGIGIMHEPGCGIPNPGDIVAEIEARGRTT